MKVLNLPFTKKIGIKKSSIENYLLELQPSKNVLNHIETIHGSASFALAETTSGYFLFKNFTEIAEETIPILRNATIKYRIGTDSALFSKAKLKGTTVDDILLQLKFKKRSVFMIEVKLYTEDNTVVCVSEFEWFETLKR